MKNNRHHKPVLLLAAIFVSQLLTAQGQKSWQWVRHLGGSGWDVTTGIATDSKNNIYIAGSHTNGLTGDDRQITAAGNHDMYVACYRHDGKLKWLWGNGGKKADKISCIAIDAQDNILIGGTLSDSVEFGKTTAGNKGNSLFLAMLDKNGKATWVSTIPYTRNASLHLLQATPAGDIFLAGEFNGKLTIDGVDYSSAGRNDIFVLKAGQNGKLTLLSAFGSDEDENITALSADVTGNLYLCGNCKKGFSLGEVILDDPGPQNKSNVFIIRYNTQDKAELIKTLSGNEFLQVSSLKNDREGNLFIAGNFSSGFSTGDTGLISKGRTDMFLTKLFPDGKTSWTKHFGSPYYDYAYNLNMDNLQGVYLTGSYSDSIRFGEHLLEAGTKSSNAFVAQASMHGDITWAEKISAESENFSRGSVLDKSGNLYISGSFSDSLTQAGTRIRSAGNEDVFIAKYYNCPETKGAIENALPLCPGQVRELFVDRGYKNITWNDTLAGSNRFVISKPGCYHVKMFDKRGCLVTDTVSIPLAAPLQFSLGRDTVLYLEEKLLLEAPEGYTGYRWHDLSIERGYLAEAAGSRPGRYSYWVCASDSSGCHVSDTITVQFIKNTHWTGIDEATEVSIYPNPAEDWLYWSISTLGTGKITLELTDQGGKVIHLEEIEKYIPGTIRQINMEAYPSGTYYLGFRNNQYRKTVPVAHNRKY
ncbi:MAG: SBBP repeat-containing protein [Bacteroidales bacterium]|nr:SBBP repeat-containing protein [Bacteroidales bacterium]